MASNLKYISPVVSTSLPLWKTIDDVSDGIIGMLRNPTDYIPKEDGETDKNYNIRLQKATWIDAFNDTIDGLNGLVFKNPIQYEVNAKLQPMIENANAMGDHMDIVIENIFDKALRKGIAFAYVDMPKAENVQNKADELKQGIRPYVTIIEPENITSWKTIVTNGQIVLSQIKIREFVEVDVDGNDFETETVEQYRILEIGSWKVIRPTENGDSLIDEGTTNLKFIPLVGLNLGQEGFFTAKPPFYDLASLNIGHYQIFTDSRHSAHIASVPMLKLLGFEQDEAKNIVISANKAIVTGNSEASVEWLDYDGNGVNVNKTLMDKLEMKMAEMGLAVITGDKTMTATEVQISSDKGQSKLNKYVRNLIDAVELIFTYGAAYYNLDDGGSIAIDSDILSTPLTAQEMIALNNMVSAGNMSLKTMYAIIQSGSFKLDDEFDIEEEKLALETQNLLSDNSENV